MRECSGKELKPRCLPANPAGEARDGSTSRYEKAGKRSQGSTDGKDSGEEKRDKSNGSSGGKKEMSTSG